jgi:hypothetical protein
MQLYLRRTLVRSDTWGSFALLCLLVYLSQNLPAKIMVTILYLAAIKVEP